MFKAETRALRLNWNTLMITSGLSNDTGATYFEQLCAAYNEPHRFYHDLNHIASMLGLLEASGFDTPLAQWAVWYHDVIYKPGSTKNEKRSAELAELIMRSLNVDEDLIRNTVQTILETKNHQTKSTKKDVLAVLDADMSILGMDEEIYLNYRESVRKEFSHIPNFLYRRGRKKFIKSILKQPYIYHLDWFRARLEKQARKNMTNELKLL